jgi:hypothetical protein
LDERWLGLCSARQGEVISDFMCETCAKKVDCNKRVCLDTMNNTIVLHLKVRACSFHNVARILLPRCRSIAVDFSLHHSASS